MASALIESTLKNTLLLPFSFLLLLTPCFSTQADIRRHQEEGKAAGPGLYPKFTLHI